jgi:hypothetical protein
MAKHTAVSWAMHTPGPWTSRKRGSFRWDIHAERYGEDTVIATVDFGLCEMKGPHADEQAANARVVALAPELLAELANLVRRIERDNLHTTAGVDVRAAREVLHKFFGEGG